MVSKKILAVAVCIAMVLSCSVAGTAATGLPLPPSAFTGALQAPAADTVREDGYIEVVFSCPEAGGMDGRISISEGLELVGFTSAGISAQLCADDHVVAILGDPVTYVYKINGKEGDAVSISLTEAESADGKGGLFAMTDETWEAAVLPAGSEQAEPIRSMLEAAAVMTGPEVSSVPAGGTVDIVFISPEGGGMDGEIRVSDNLTFERMRSEDLGVQLSAQDHVVSLFADPVTYTYRVNAQPGEEISVELINAKTADEYRNLYTVPEQSWTAAVGEPDETSWQEPAPEPEPPAAEAPDADGSFMVTPSAAVEGKCIEVQFTSPRDGGIEGYIEVSDNLTFEGLQGGFLSAELSNERKAVSLFGEPLTYVYRVNAEAGEDISVSLARGQQSDGNCSLSPLEPEVWSCTVQPAADGAEAPEAFVAMMDVPQPEGIVEGATIDVSFLSPLAGGMDGLVSASSNLRFMGTVSAGNGARMSTSGQVKAMLGAPVTYRYRVTGQAGDPVYVRLTDGRMADGTSNMSSKVRNQIWMGVIQEAPLTDGIITPSPASGIHIGASGLESVPGSYLTGADSAGSVAGLLAQLSVPASMDLEILEADGTPADGSARIATGQIVRASQDGQETGRATVVVAGDVTGRGAPGVGQMVRLAAACTGGKPLEGAYLLAGDLNRNGSMDIGDLACLVSLIQAGR